MAETSDPRSSSPAAGGGRWRRRVLEFSLILGLFLLVQWVQGRDLLPAGSAPLVSSLQSLSGPVRLQELRGKRVLLHFWATWCSVCRMEHGMLQAMHRSLSEDEVLVSVVADAEDREALRRYVQESSIDYPVAFATRELLEQFRVRAYPTNYYLDAGGKVSSASVGMSNRFAVWARLNWARLSWGHPAASSVESRVAR